PPDPLLWDSSTGLVSPARSRRQGQRPQRDSNRGWGAKQRRNPSVKQAKTRAFSSSQTTGNHGRRRLPTLVRGQLGDSATPIGLRDQWWGARAGVSPVRAFARESSFYYMSRAPR